MFNNKLITSTGTTLSTKNIMEHTMCPIKLLASTLSMSLLFSSPIPALPVNGTTTAGPYYPYPLRNTTAPDVAIHPISHNHTLNATMLHDISSSISRPLLPLSASGRWIVDASGNRFKLRCINWPAHLETNIPEGLHRVSLGPLTRWIRDAGFNCVRLTYSIDLALNPNVPVFTSFQEATASTGVPPENLLVLYAQAVTLNPFLTTATVREVHSIVIAALWSIGIVTVLDNHVSRAGWCCNLDDGNGWWSDAPGYAASNSRYFDSDEWMTGLRETARWARRQEGVVGMSLRNELRATWSQILFAIAPWYEKMKMAGNAVHEDNPDVLVIVGGLNGGTDLSSLKAWLLDTSGWPRKNVWETHDYSFTITTPNFLDNCGIQKMEYGGLYGFLLEQYRQWTGPLFMSEFGVNLQGGKDGVGLNGGDKKYLECLVDYLEENDADWALWALPGSYYVRYGVVDMEDTWGILNYEWTDWRNPEFGGMLGDIWQMTQVPDEEEV